MSRLLVREPPLASYHELQTVYSLKDLYDLLEVAEVDAHNHRVVAKYEEREMKRARDS